MFVIGMAYRGTANNAAIQKLLHFAVSDVSDDVRRAAVLCLGFVLLGVPEQCPRIVSLLSQSYNPHVRYGAAMAVGICCSGTGVSSYHTTLWQLLRSPCMYHLSVCELTSMCLQLTDFQKRRRSSVRKFASSPRLSACVAQRQLHQSGLYRVHARCQCTT